MDTSFQISENSPPVYKIRFMPSELKRSYEDILSNATVNEVYDAFCKHVTTHIEPVGWRAVWRTHFSGDTSVKFDFEVEVMDVLHKSLESVAIVLKLIHPNEHELTTEQFDEKEKLLKELKIVNIPLIDLYVISADDVDEQYGNTALLIEQIRFFYRNLWRPWDELANTEASNDEIFVETKLTPRLELSFDMKDKIIPQSTVNMIQNLLREGWNLKNKICSIDTTFGCSDKYGTEEYINESDFLEALRLKLRLEDIEREMKLLEDKHMRAVFSSLKKGINTSFVCEEVEPNSEGKKIHLISKRFKLFEITETLASLTSIIDDTDIPVIFNNNIANAIDSAKTGDKIYIMPGKYQCPVIPWMETNIEVIGFADSNDKVVLESNESSGDIFLNCNSGELKFSCLTMRSNSEIQSLVMIHSGCVAFENCILDGTNCLNTLTVLSKAKLEIDKCQVMNNKGEKIVSSKGSVVISKDTDIKTDLSAESIETEEEFVMTDIVDENLTLMA